jgi:hypothetical protein
MKLKNLTKYTPHKCWIDVTVIYSWKVYLNWSCLHLPPCSETVLTKRERMEKSEATVWSVSQVQTVTLVQVGWPNFSQPRYWTWGCILLLFLAHRFFLFFSLCLSLLFRVVCIPCLFSANIFLCTSSSFRSVNHFCVCFVIIYVLPYFSMSVCFSFFLSLQSSVATGTSF